MEFKYKCLWIVRDCILPNGDPGKRVTIYDGDDESAPVITTQYMGLLEYQQRTASHRGNRLVAVRIVERTS